MKNRKKKRKEEGQAMIEFALVLPIFLLLVMGILDFGFLFYNYISLENSARNAARIACVDYDDIAYDSSQGGIGGIKHCVLKLPSENATSKDAYSSSVKEFSTGNGDESTSLPFSESEKAICMEVARSIENTGIVKDNVTVIVEYTYDTSETASYEGWDVKKRHTGDVTVTVKGQARVLTPVLGVSADHMKKDMGSKSTFKVEEQIEEVTNS